MPNRLNVSRRIVRQLATRDLSAFVVVLAGTLSVAEFAAAEIPDLATDRPDFTESAVVVPLRALQIETGFSWEAAPGDLDAFTAPEALVRYSPAPRTELRFEVPNYGRVEVPDDASWEPLGGTRDPLTKSGLGDPAFGAKFQLGPVGAIDIAAIAMVSVPWAETEFTTDGFNPEFALTASRGLGERWSLGAQGTAAWAGDASDRERVLGGTVVLGAALSSEWGSFLEIAVESEENTEAATLVHHGYTRALGANLQLDLHGGVGLSDRAPDHFLGAGFSARLVR